MNIRWLAPAGLAAAAALGVAACGSSSSGNSASVGGSGNGASPTASHSMAAGGSAVKARTISGKKVLTNSAGMTLYWFVPDTAHKSVCNGSCATYWPPVKGPVTAGAGVTGMLGTITRSDGTRQATYDGHPLYTYVADSAPGQDKGNGLNVNGGLWWNVNVNGSTPSPSHSPKSGGSGGGSGGSGY
jgi:predicted lipoprotein with Yx(FWY)xxD motif